MNKRISLRSITIALVCAVGILYLFAGTGLHSDEYSVIGSWRDWQDFFSPDPFKRRLMIFGLPSYYSFWWVYFVLGHEHQWIYDLVKCAAHLVSVYCVYRFASDYFPRDRALLASILFVFYPLHDTTMYWYMTAPYVFFPAIILYAHALIRNDNKLYGSLLQFLGAFSYYFSPPYVFGLAAVFLFERKYKKAALFAFPGALYIAFYFRIKLTFSGIESRIDSRLDFMDLLKQFMLQILSFIEAAIGPSYWLKIYFAIGSLGLVSALIAACIVVYLFIRADSFSDRHEFPKSLFAGLLCIVLFSFGIYAMTGRYHHSAFNLGN